MSVATAEKAVEKALAKRDKLTADLAAAKLALAAARDKLTQEKAAERERAKAKPDPKKAKAAKPKKPAGCDAPDCAH